MPDVFAGRRRVPRPENDPNLSYAPGTPARADLKARLAQMAAQTVDIPIIIGGKEIRSGATGQAVMPHKRSRPAMRRVSRRALSLRAASTPGPR